MAASVQYRQLPFPFPNEEVVGYHSKYSPRIMTSPPVRLLNRHLPLVLPRPMHKQQQKRRDGEEDAVHNAECKASFPHRAFFVGVRA